jgi:sulfatase maturation enzyme AslB (radical SAM superfamily)
LLRYKEIFLGGPCNNNCLYCSAAHKTSAQTDFNKISASLIQKEEDSVALYGGEPMLRNDLPEIIRAAAGNGFRRIKLRTNGRAFSDGQFLQQVMTAGCHLFEIKLWGSNPSLHDYMTRTQGSFGETMNGLENLAGYPGDKFVCIRIPVCKENYPDMENTVVTALNFGVNRIVLSVQGYNSSFQSFVTHIRNAVNISIFNRTWILVEGLPFCAAQGLEAHMGEIYYGWDNIYDRTFRQHKYCAECVYRELCPGVEAGYLDRFGDTEFTPVLGNKYFTDIKALHE